MLLCRRPRASVAFTCSLAVVAACGSANDGALGDAGADDGPDGVTDTASEPSDTAAAELPPSSGDVTSPDDTPADNDVPANALAEAVTYPATSLGLAAFSPNGRIQPHGAPTTYHFEYGATQNYGAVTPTRTLAPRLAAYYAESWDSGRGGWRGGDPGPSQPDFTYLPAGGMSGGFVRYREPTGNDYNHVDGIGTLHLVSYFYPGEFDLDAPSAALGGADPDFRDARVAIALRGVDWHPGGTELLWWSQSDVRHGEAGDLRYTNWAHTGLFLTDHLLSGAWERVEYRLDNDTTQWTYAGTNREIENRYNKHVYYYDSIDDVLAHLDIDFFHLLAYADVEEDPSGAIDFDELVITYRNHSLLLGSNGGTLISPPGAEVLTDGWRFGVGHTWHSAPFPKEPVELVYRFADPVTIQRVQIHNDPEWPSAAVEVLVSSDGVGWTTIATGTLPESSPDGPNFTYLLWKGPGVDATDPNAPPWGLAASATQLKVRILGGYHADAWGLGEIEVFGDGAQLGTDDDWYRVNDDITGLDSGTTYHYRLVASVGGTTVVGGDRTFTVPADATPEVAAGAAYRIAAGGARLEARLNTLGAEAQIHFEYGPDTAYGATTEPRRAGPEITPRTVVATLSGLTAGATVHFRLVAVGSAGSTYGPDAEFVAR